MVAVAAIIGLLLGHLFDLSLDRLYSDQPLAKAIRRCAACQSETDRRYLVPYLGYLWYRGRCRQCGAVLPTRAVLLPAGGVALFLLAFFALDGWGPALLAGLFSTLFLALAFTDLERRLIPNRIVYPGILLAAALAWAWPDRDVVAVFAGGGAAFAISFAMYVIGRGALGFGDVKMTTLMGLTAGFPAMLVGFFLGVFAAGAVVAALLLLRVVGRRDYIAYGPYIALGGIVATLWGPAIVDWYLG